jgi:hypothetical protein
MWDMECQPDPTRQEYVFRIRPAAPLSAKMPPCYCFRDTGHALIGRVYADGGLNRPASRQRKSH